MLAAEGARGLTHRAIDRCAGVPLGTASNYFRSRGVLIAGLVERIAERLTPSAEFLAERAGAEPSRALFAEYLRDIVRRLLGQQEVLLALFELRLESVRRPEVADQLVVWRRTAFEGDVAFNAGAGFPGGAREIALFHYAMDGLLLDRLTGPLQPEADTDAVIDDLVAGLLPPAG